MKKLQKLVVVGIMLGAAIALSGCAATADARQSGVNNRQDRIDSRTAGRNERWKERGEREDARAEARFNSW